MIIKGHQLQQQQNIIFKSGADITITAQIDSFFKQIRHGYEGTVLLRSINGQSLPYFLQPKIRLVSDYPFQLGDKIEATVFVKAIYGQLNEVGFDIESYYFSQGWLAKASVNHRFPFIVASQYSYRQLLYERTLKKLDHSEVKGPIIALVFGQRNFITPLQWQQYRDSGLIHLIAISGLHIGVMFFVGFCLGKILSRCSSTLIWAPWIIGTGLACGYAWLAGFSIPTCRALIMCILASIFVLSNNRQSPLKKLLITLSIVLLIYPFSGLSSSFWLSFYAVSMLIFILGQPAVTHQSTEKKSNLFTGLKVQLLIVYWMFPITAFLFDGVSLSSLLYNVIFVPWFSFLVVPSIFFALFMTMLDADFSLLCWQLVEYLLLPVQWSSGYASGTWAELSINQVYLVITVCCAMFMGYYLNWQARVWLAVVLLTVVVHNWIQKEDETKWKVDILDVGHGLSILIERNGRAVVYDTGNRWQQGSIAESLLLPLLRKRGIHELDALILSHLDADHAGGRGVIEDTLSPRLKIAPQTLSGYQPCIRGKHWIWQGLKFDILWPEQQVERAYNPHSCVIRVTDEKAQFSLLLTGDIDALVEWILLRTPKELQSDVLIVPHHGSATSSIPQFIESVNPQLAIASLSKGGRWRLPDEKVVQRYNQRGITWLDTGQYGQVTIYIDENLSEIDKNMWQVSAIRQAEGERWYRQMLRNGVE
ncbi:DNA internalization-related competence protein ComEC/Rec2 [Vibrio sp. ZSDE26]|uniref:DNA internalization-related competence protein ComEC/Rec2 n=1 Tax=Vibrio amylolyticus TaxID=2847292 RepID=A0A9X1XJI3_9VIBR|nr:DNA internalization-related competence protein ComEC/Rec2 [Vibrio amylolyticus]